MSIKNSPSKFRALPVISFGQKCIVYCVIEMVMTAPITITVFCLIIKLLNKNYMWVRKTNHEINSVLFMPVLITCHKLGPVVMMGQVNYVAERLSAC